MKIKFLSCFVADCKISKWMFSLISLWIIVTGLLLLPHLLIIYKQISNSIDITYSPAVLNSTWTRFDDIVKLYPSWQFAENFTFLGKLSVPDFRNIIYPNVLQESIVIIPNAIVIWLTGKISAPFYFTALLVGFTAVFTAIILLKWTKMPVLSISGAFLMIFAYHLLSPDQLALIIEKPLDYLRSVDKRTDFPSNYNSFYRVHALGATYFVLLAYIYWLWNILEKNKAGVTTVLTGSILLALQFYTYLFYSILAVGITTLAIISAWSLFIFSKNGNKYRAHAMTMLAVAIVAALLSLPSWHNTFNMVFDNKYSDWLEMIKGATSDKLFYGTAEVTIITLLLTIILPGRALKIIFLGTGTSVLLIENAQPLFGFNVQPGHLYNRAASPLLLIGIIVMSARIMRKYFSQRKLTFIGQLSMILVVIIYGFLVIRWANNYCNYNWRDQGITSTDKQLFNWIRKNNKSGDTWAILFPNMNEKVAVYTKATVYLPFSGHQPGDISIEVIKNHLSIMLWLGGANNEDIDKYVVSGYPDRRYERYTYYNFHRYYESRAQSNKYLAKDLKKRIKYYKLKSVAKDAYLPTYLILGGDGPIMALFNQPEIKYVTKKEKFGKYTIYLVNKDRIKNDS